MNKTADLAHGKWDSILSILAPNLQEAIESKRHVPCPIHGGKDGFRLFNDGSGGGVCNTCGSFSDGFKVLEWINGWDFKKAAHEVDLVVGNAEYIKPNPVKKDPMPRILHAKKLIAMARKGDPVAKYLQSRGIQKGNKAIGYIQKYPYYDNGNNIGEFPVMACPITTIDCELASYHITYLGDGVKAAVSSPKKILPPNGTIQGCSIKFGRGPHIVIAEGIENTLAAMQDFGLPGFAAVTALGMENIELPEWVKAVTIIGDNDKSFAGQKAAYTLANKLYIKKVEVKEVVMPFEKGHDYIDMAYPKHP